MEKLDREEIPLPTSTRAGGSSHRIDFGGLRPLLRPMKPSRRVYRTHTTFDRFQILARVLLWAGAMVLLSSCSEPPRTCFDRAVLNCNMFHDFASRGMDRQLESPTVKLTDAKTGATAPMTRKEVVDDKVAFLERSFEKVRKLHQNDDNRDMVQASLALYEFVLPVYRDDYRRLAKLYDDGAPKQAIAQLTASIATQYGPPFAALSDRLTTAGKAYAARHDLKVMWDIRTSPSK